MAWYDVGEWGVWDSFGGGDDFGGYDSQDEYDFYETDNGEFDQSWLENNMLGGRSIDDYTSEYDDSSWFSEPSWVSKADNVPNKYTGAGSILGGLFGGKDGSLSGSDLMGYASKGIDAYMGKRENDRYNEMMQPMTDLYRAQAADVQNRRDNRDANLAGEYSEWEGLMQPSWDRRDQRADNLRQAQGQTQSSTSAWNRAASEQSRDATKLAARRAMSKDYDTRTGTLGGQLSALNPLMSEQKGIRDNYISRQEDPWLGMLTQGIIG